MTTTQRDDQWRHWLREHARAFVISGEPLWAELLTVLADSNGPEDTGPITLTSQSGRARVLMTSPSEDVYLAAARLLPVVEISCPDPQCNDSTWDHECEWSTRPNHELAECVVDGLWPLIHAAGVAAGRAQAAADIRASTPDVTITGPVVPADAVIPATITVDYAAKIAGGEPRG